MISQDQVFSYCLNQVAIKMRNWFPEENIQIWEQNQDKEVALYLVLLGFDPVKDRNIMETLQISRPHRETGTVEVEIPVPRMFYLKMALVPVCNCTADALNLSSALLRNIYDDPFIDMHEMNWYGNENSKAVIEIQESGDTCRLYGSLAENDPFKLNIQVLLGINSLREERITRVAKRQFTVIKNKK